MRKIEEFPNFLCYYAGYIVSLSLILREIALRITMFAVLSNKCCGQTTVCLRMKMRDVRDA